jgi:tetratricopeptide (TPR) repeat protein
MKTKFNFYLLFIFSLVIFKNAYSDDFSDAIGKAKKDFLAAANKIDKATLTKVRGQFERILQLKRNEWLVNYYLADVDLTLSYSAMQDKNNDDIKKYTESSLKLLDKCTDVKDDFAEAYILKMAVNSNRFMYEMDKMNDIISKQSEAKDKAKKLEPDNPRYYLIDGMNTYYTPEAFGGGVDNALPLFQKSYELFKTYKPKDETYPNWGYDMCAGMLAMCSIKLDKMDAAKEFIDKALEINPDSGFIKNEVQKAYDEKKSK